MKTPAAADSTASTAPAPRSLNPFRGLTREHWTKVALLFSWFFLAISAFWLLKPVRVASLLTHLGAAQTPYLKIGSMLAVGVVVAVYTRLIDRVSRRNLAMGVGVLFAGLFVAFWLAMRLGGEALRASPVFVWAFYILADVYSTVMVAVFWTYTNDVVTPGEADRLYGPIGLGGILGGVVGGVGADALARPIGPTNLLLICAGLAVTCAFLAAATERILKPAPRRRAPEPSAGASRPRSGFHVALDGAREVAASRYLLMIVGIMVAYEIASTMNDFAINVMFERSFRGSTAITQMYGRMGWVINVTALVAQLLVVPFVLPRKRVALLIVPVAMMVFALGLVALPVVAMVFALAASDNGLSYSVQQSTKETLWVPLSDAQKYKAKAFIDMFVLRAAKAVASGLIIAVTALAGTSLRISLLIGVASLGVWMALASALARRYNEKVAGARAASPDNTRRPTRDGNGGLPAGVVRPSMA